MKKHLIKYLFLAVLFSLFAMNRFLKNDLGALKVWSQFSKRLFDEDLPKVKPSKEKEFDMTDI